MNKKDYLYILGAIILIIIFWWFLENNRLYIASKIEIYVPFFSKIEEYDSHEKFLDFGSTIIKVYYSENQANKFLEQIKDDENWYNLPILEGLQEDLDNETKDFKINKIKVKNGYWFSRNRETEVNIHKEVDYLSEFYTHPLRHTSAIFDTDNNILYFYETGL